MSGFYDVENLGEFSVTNQAVQTQYTVRNLVQNETHEYGVMSVFPNDTVLTQTYSAAEPLTLTNEFIISGMTRCIRTPDNTGAFANGGTGAFVPSQVKRYYINYLPTSMIQFDPVTKFFPSDYQIATNFGFSTNNSYRYYDASNQELPVFSNLVDETHLSGIPKYFGVGPNIQLGRGTEVLLMWNLPAPSLGYPLTARYLLRNAYDWLTSTTINGPASDCYNPKLAPYQNDLNINIIPAAGNPNGNLFGKANSTNGVIMVPIPNHSAQWYV